MGNRGRGRDDGGADPALVPLPSATEVGPQSPSSLLPLCQSLSVFSNGHNRFAEDNSNKDLDENVR